MSLANSLDLGLAEGYKRKEGEYRWYCENCGAGSNGTEQKAEEESIAHLDATHHTVMVLRFSDSK